jgi:ubiquinone/menaquinone biosynthesis C-methylase UbiE
VAPVSAQPDPARSFGSVVDAYDRGRPGYPADAATWLAGPEAQAVLELGAGTGKLTEALVALGHEVHATDPDDAMLARLRARLPDVPTSVAPAEELPAPDAAYDVVVAGQAFHWFDQDRALGEIARVLRPGGRFVVTFSNRCFPTKAIRGWLSTDDDGHVQIVNAYFALSGGFGGVRAHRRAGRGGDPLYAVWAARPDPGPPDG